MSFPIWTEPIQTALNRAAEHKLSSVAVDALALARLFEAWDQERTVALKLQMGGRPGARRRALRTKGINLR